MDFRPVGVASVGIGWWSNVHADSIVKSDKLRLVSCYTRSPGKREEFAGKYGCRKAQSYEQLLDDPEVEAVILTTPHAAHAEQILAAAARGKHLFVEKPIATTIADAKRSIEACSEAGVVLALGHNQRRRAGHRKIKELLDKGAAGHVMSAEGHFSSDIGLALTPRDWRYYKAESPGGPLTSMAVHIADTFNYLFGPPSRVASFFAKRCTDSEIEDATISIVEYRSGVLASISCNFVTPRTSFVNIYGTEANYFCNDGAELFVHKKGSSAREAIELENIGAIKEELEEFARCVRAGQRPETAGEEGLEALAVILAMVESAKAGKPVLIDEIKAGDF